MTRRPLCATYRLQFRNGVGFAEATALVPYLKALGVSHFYASPIFEASPGSTHGYDVVDYNRFEPELGGEEGFTALSDALRAAGIGLILDFVPNHMGVSPANRWWEDVLRWGEESRQADTFDISWEAERILIPVLGRPYGEALEGGDLTIVLDAKDTAFRFSAGGYELPIDPRTFPDIFAFLDHPLREPLIRRFAAAVPADAQDLSERLTDSLKNAGFRTALDSAIEAINADRAALHALHERQHWRLAWWRLAREKLSYRRFFEIADLIGVRQEIRRVFRDSHRRVVRLAGEGRLDGIRIDHVDGVADPKAYLSDLREAMGAAGKDDIVIHVEKILTGPERLRRSWNVEGTTGYEFITALSGLYVDAAQEEAMSAAYEDFVDDAARLEALVHKQKRAIFSQNLAGELSVLSDEALGVARRGLSTRDFGPDTLTRSILEVATALPVYRTYSGVDGVPPEDAAIIDEAVAWVKANRKVEADEPVEFVGRLLKLDFEDGRDMAGALNFTRRFQQTTGAVMAKAVEDTVFYQWNRLIALNEVGGEPDHYGADPAAFHAAMAVRIEDQPEGLLALSTHDTKRGEDARARIYTISEAPEQWNAIVKEMAGRLAHVRESLEDGGVSPDPATEWGFYQSLLGVLPADFNPADGKARESISTRMKAFMQKAVREAKRFTSWTAPNEPYEAALERFVEAAIEDEAVIRPFWESVQPFVAAGALTSLSQTLIRLGAPGVPDIYQGTEFWDNSLVDPDNRRPIDFAAVQAALEAGEDPDALAAAWRDGRVKAALNAAGLNERAAAPDLWTYGAYVPLELEGPAAGNFIAFARVSGEQVGIVIAPRLCLGLLDGARDLSPAQLRSTTITLPDALAGLALRDRLTGRSHGPGQTLDLATLFGPLPMALLVTRAH
ncbi:malto-oligosyltrehalose synthase [Aureimonas frigidaquae]|uniref:Putative maltooligosyl trehalose synthase protein n=1 Tax=Aureimonas frigidaquae TaxID=424757 RepID=A0A0P0Z265_9HYPH|nr:malto-oligosyltrehalose synthase [Aureimonas frigidaquae]BAT27955.1 putative maltooligosyl trehalose synthase protein [Aureimonas frigidaquae]